MPAINEWKTRAAEHLRRDSEDWRIEPRQARLLILIPFIIAVVAAAALPFKDFYLWTGVRYRHYDDELARLHSVRPVPREG